MGTPTDDEVRAAEYRAAYRRRVLHRQWVLRQLRGDATAGLAVHTGWAPVRAAVDEARLGDDQLED